MSKKQRGETYRSRRTLLKAIGVTMGATSYGSTVSVAHREQDGGDGKREDEKEEDGDEREGDRERRDGWTGPRSGPARTGTTDGNGPTPYPTLDWKLDLDGSMYSVEPIVDDETVYLAVTTDGDESEGYVCALDVDTGDEQWRRSDLPAQKTPAVDDEMLYFATRINGTSDADEGGFYALDADTGETEWTRTDHDVWSPPVAADELVFSSNRDGTYAFDRESGDTVWKADGVDGLTDDVGDALTFTDETVFLSDGTALEADDGSVKWRVSPENGTLGNPTVHDETVYYTRTERLVGNDDHVAVEARSADTGAVEWTHESGNNGWDGRLAVTDDHVFLLDLDDEEAVAKALDAETGATAWTTAVEGSFFSSPAVGDGTVYVGGRYVPSSTASTGRALVHAIDGATGDRKWTYLLDSSDLETSPEDPPAAGTPVVTGGKLFAPTYPAGSTLDYRYVYYANCFVLESCDERPDADHRLPTDDESDDRCNPPKPEACIEATPGLDSDDLDAGDAVWLDASCSTGSELRYRWDTDDDGRCDESGVSICVTVPSCGSLTVELEVTDANDATDTANVTISTN